MNLKFQVAVILEGDSEWGAVVNYKLAAFWGMAVK